MHEDPVDEFLFVTRRGFCEFYASAFTVLMRAAGVPARVVTGYQGGEFNAIGEYLIVRQRDAHAWAEVWLEGRGWVRVDPTGAVSPDRIERGVDVALPPSLGASALGIALGLAPGGELAQALRAIRHSWDTVNNSWNQWVVDYGEKRQRRLLDRFGIDVRDWRSIAVALLLVGACALGVCAWWLTRRPEVSDQALRVYLVFCRKLRRRGLGRESFEGPQTFAARVAKIRPDLGTEVVRITGLYLGLRYAGEYSRPALGELERDVARFRP